MERLTNKKEADARRKQYEIRLASGYPRNIPEERFLKLAAYEDTWLEPEDFDALQKREQGLAELLVQVSCGCAVSYARLAELAQAEKDGRLVALPCDKVRWVKAILTERDRQDQKWGYPQKNSFCEWASIIAEEVGELSKELNELNFGRGTLNQMEAEAVQVAAVALSILEQSAVAHMVTVQVAVALSRLTREEAEAALKKREAGKIDTR